MSKEITIPARDDWGDQEYGLYDLKEALSCVKELPFGTPTKAQLHAAVMGENDESDWYWVLTVDNKNYLATGGCDYTGWGCMGDHGEITEYPSVEAAIKATPKVEQYSDRTIRKWLQAQVDGKLPIGVVDAV